MLKQSMLLLLMLAGCNNTVENNVTAPAQTIMVEPTPQPQNLTEDHPVNDQITSNDKLENVAEDSKSDLLTTKIKAIITWLESPMIPDYDAQVISNNNENYVFFAKGREYGIDLENYPKPPISMNYLFLNNDRNLAIKYLTDINNYFDSKGISYSELKLRGADTERKYKDFDVENNVDYYHVFDIYTKYLDPEGNIKETGSLSFCHSIKPVVIPDEGDYGGYIYCYDFIVEKGKARLIRNTLAG